MRKYEEMIAEFSAFGLAGREKWISKLPLEELKVLEPDLIMVLHTDLIFGKSG